MAASFLIVMRATQPPPEVLSYSEASVRIGRVKCPNYNASLEGNLASLSPAWSSENPYRSTAPIAGPPIKSSESNRPLRLSVKQRALTAAARSMGVGVRS